MQNSSSSSSSSSGKSGRSNNQQFWTITPLSAMFHEGGGEGAEGPRSGHSARRGWTVRADRRQSYVQGGRADGAVAVVVMAGQWRCARAGGRSRSNPRLSTGRSLSGCLMTGGDPVFVRVSLLSVVCVCVGVALLYDVLHWVCLPFCRAGVDSSDIQ